MAPKPMSTPFNRANTAMQPVVMAPAWVLRRRYAQEARCFPSVEYMVFERGSGVSAFGLGPAGHDVEDVPSWKALTRRAVTSSVSAAAHQHVRSLVSSKCLRLQWHTIALVLFRQRNSLQRSQAYRPTIG